LLLDGALIGLEPGSQLVDGYAVDIALDQLLDLVWSKAPADPFRGAEDGLRLGWDPV
jgi:hypothetical protein